MNAEHTNLSGESSQFFFFLSFFLSFFSLLSVCSFLSRHSFDMITFLSLFSCVSRLSDILLPPLFFFYYLNCFAYAHFPRIQGMLQCRENGKRRERTFFSFCLTIINLIDVTRCLSQKKKTPPKHSCCSGFFETCVCVMGVI